MNRELFICIISLTGIVIAVSASVWLRLKTNKIKQNGKTK